MTLKNITVLGSGIMGHGIAQISAMSGYKVKLRDIEKQFLDKAMDKVKWSLQKLAEKNKITNDQVDEFYNNITPIVDLSEAVKETDLIIEAVPEDYNLKRSVYKELDKLTDSRTIYASNTSTLPITELSKLIDNPKRFIGVHFFNPPQLMRLVEIIPGIETDPLVIEHINSFVKKIKKTPILCKKDVAGFIVNRIFIPLVHEAAYCLDRDNVSMEIIDSAVKYRLDFPMGIFELADYTGLDVIYKATYEMNLRDKKVLLPHPKIKELYEAKHFGQKSGKGFYEYKGDKYERIDLSEQKASKYDPISILAVASNNASWLISNEVCSKEDLESALKLGMGLKTEIFKLAEKIGIQKVLHELNRLKEKHGEFYIPNEYLLSLK
ncbi:MAG: 3-hydroxyacyl-CoA dehydrogenase family protein [Nitrosopumilus sp.]|nr:3-hydroxyacyl-CoA dehydrogenase family protein [Nitrosopumilus sp.]